MAEVHEESQGGYGMGDELMAHDAEMHELVEEGGGFGSGCEGGVPVVVGAEVNL